MTFIFANLFAPMFNSSFCDIFDPNKVAVFTYYFFRYIVNFWCSFFSV